jgi:hypothetical protein
MVRRGSTVRVRQRALSSRRTARKWAVFVASLETGEHLLRKEGRDKRKDCWTSQNWLDAGVAELGHRVGEIGWLLGTGFGDT